MIKYTPMSAKSRFDAIDQMATVIFGTKRWKTDLADRYALSRQTIGTWSRNGAPVWAYVAMRDAMAARSLLIIQDAIIEAEARENPTDEGTET